MKSGPASTATSWALGLLAAAATLWGFWLYLGAALLSVLAALLTLAEPLHGLLGFIVLAPEAAPYAQLPMPSGIPDLTFPRMGVALVLGSVLLRVVFGGEKLPRIGGAEKAMLAFLAVIYVDLYFRGRSFESEALIVFDEFATPFLFFYLARIVFRSPGAHRKFLYAVVLMGVIVGAHGAYQYATHGSIGSDERAAAVGPSDSGHVDKGRAAGPFVNSVEYGGAVGLAFVWALLLVLYETRGILRSLLFLVLLFLGGAAVLSLTRSVWLGIFLAVSSVAWLDRRSRRTIVVGLAAAGVAGIVATAIVSLDETRIEERAFSYEPVYIRLVMYRASVAMVLDKPLFGYGRGESRFVQERQPYLTSFAGIPAEYGNMAGPPHNVYLFTLLQWGLVGLVCYLAAFVALARTALAERRKAKGSNDAELRRAFVYANFFLATTVFYLVQAIFADVTAFLFFTTVYFVGAGIVPTLSFRVKEFAVSQESLV